MDAESSSRPNPFLGDAVAGRAEDIAILVIDASAGGQDACRDLLSALGRGAGMAFIFLLESLEDLARPAWQQLEISANLKVRPAAVGMEVEIGTAYAVTEGAGWSVVDGTFQLAGAETRGGAALRDSLLLSLAASHGSASICILLSGAGSGISSAQQAFKAAGGLIIVEASSGAMQDGTRDVSAFDSGTMVMPARSMAEAILALRQRAASAAASVDALGLAENGIEPIIEFVRAVTEQDFSFYKTGTLHRRIIRRMAMAGFGPRGIQAYLERLRGDRAELDLLAQDLLINVTGFFRDPDVFEVLAAEVVPGLVRNHVSDGPLRIWVAGCSTGEEAYSLAMLFQEELSTTRPDLKVQIFATDIDPDAVAAARDGLYSESIENAVSPKRLTRFFSKEDGGYRASGDLRAAIIFTVHDVLTDPPFSRLDMVSCRNLLIYLQASAQARVTALFHFALRPKGVLLLGSSETLSESAGHFLLASNAARLYRYAGRSRPGPLGFSALVSNGVRVAMQAGGRPTVARQASLADLCRRMVLQNYGPAAALVNDRYEILYSLGPLDQYLQIPSGPATYNLLAMARPGVRASLRTATLQAANSETKVTVSGGRFSVGPDAQPYSIDVLPVGHEGERLFLICFVAAPGPAYQSLTDHAEAGSQNLSALKMELASTRAELQVALTSLEQSSEEQAAVHETALSVARNIKRRMTS